MPRRAFAMLIAVALLAGCGGAGASGPTGTPPDLGSLAAPPTSPGPEATLRPSELLTEPPAARLAAGGGAPAVDGKLGSWTLDGTASDSPWLPAAGLEIVEAGVDGRLFAGYADATPIESWKVQLASVADTAGSDLSDGGGGQANGSDFVSLGSLPAGEWVVAITLRRADGRGEATYYWVVKIG